jgi:hypothetical protein
VVSLPGVSFAQTPRVAVNGIQAPDRITLTAGTSVVVAITGGPGHSTDWVGLYRVGDGDQQYLDWRYLNATTRRPRCR